MECCIYGNRWRGLGYAAGKDTFTTQTMAGYGWNFSTTKGRSLDGGDAQIKEHVGHRLATI
jgi:hypothetical protein